MTNLFKRMLSSINIRQQQTQGGTSSNSMEKDTQNSEDFFHHTQQLLDQLSIYHQTTVTVRECSSPTSTISCADTAETIITEPRPMRAVSMHYTLTSTNITCKINYTIPTSIEEANETLKQMGPRPDFRKLGDAQVWLTSALMVYYRMEFEKAAPIANRVLCDVAWQLLKGTDLNRLGSLHRLSMKDARNAKPVLKLLQTGTLVSRC